MPTATNEVENLAPVFISMNMVDIEIIWSNSSMVTVPNENSSIPESDLDESDEPELGYWPNWVQRVMCISHLCLAFNSSVNFYIYYVKRKALNSGTALFKP